MNLAPYISKILDFLKVTIVKIKKLDRPKFFLVLFLGFLVVWFVMGSVIRGVTHYWHRNDRPPIQFMSVEMRDSKAEEITREIRVLAETKANKVVLLKAETKGQVIAIPATKGSLVQQGDVLIQIDTEDRVRILKKSESLVEQRKKELDAANQLKSKGFLAENSYAQVKAQHDEALAELETAKSEIDRLNIKAPFDGIFDDHLVDIGDFITLDGHVGTFLDLNPIQADGYIAQEYLYAINPGQPATLDFLNGQTRQGKLIYISSHAEEKTRTFKIEAEFDNPNSFIKSGLSAEIIIPIEKVKAHFISASEMSLKTNEKLSVKGLDPIEISHQEESDSTQQEQLYKVHEYTVQIVKADATGLWVAPLPDDLVLISVGQAFVNHGEIVRGYSAQQSEKDTETEQ